MSAPPSDYVYGTLTVVIGLAALYLVYRQVFGKRRIQVYEMLGDVEMTRMV